MNRMAKKENKGGELKNEQIEQDLEAQGKTEDTAGYEGSQDTGDSIVRQLGNEVQQNDGITPDDMTREKGSD